MPNHGLVRSQTRKVAEWITRGLVNSRMLLPTVVISCYVSVGILQIVKRCYVYFAPLPCVCEVDDTDNEKIALINRTWCRFVLAASSSS